MWITLWILSSPSWFTLVSGQTTINGDRCANEYIYNGRRYVGCTKDYIGISWCGLRAVVPNSLAPSTWGFCKGSGSGEFACSVTTIRGTAPEGTRCVLPFTYKGRQYSTCTGVEEKAAWCSTDAIYKGQWGICIYNATIPTVRGVANGADCYFPFEYKGVTYNYCTTVENNYIPWCATTDNYDRDTLWGACDFPNCN